MQENADENGWVVKMPYTTNREFVRGAHDYAGVVELLQLAARQYAGRVSYAFVQPCMRNKMEYRVVVLGGAPAYLASINQSAKGVTHKAFSKHPHDNLKRFAQRAVAALKKACPETISDCILRVDIFQRSDGRLVVNEFESLEARFHSTDHAEETFAISWLAEFWFNQINAALHQLSM